MARDIRGIGFKTADAIAMKLGIEKLHEGDIPLCGEASAATKLRLIGYIKCRWIG